MRESDPYTIELIEAWLPQAIENANAELHSQQELLLQVQDNIKKLAAKVAILMRTI